MERDGEREGERGREIRGLLESPMISTERKYYLIRIG